jgi:hypothetical protein
MSSSKEEDELLPPQNNNDDDADAIFNKGLIKKSSLSSCSKIQ